MWFAGENACATNGRSFARIGGAGFSLPTPACGRISSQLLRERTPLGPQRADRFLRCQRHAVSTIASNSGKRGFQPNQSSALAQSATNIGGAPGRQLLLARNTARSFLN